MSDFSDPSSLSSVKKCLQPEADMLVGQMISIKTSLANIWIKSCGYRRTQLG